jgi:hypothetical protein
MANPKVTFALIALLAASVSFPVLARGDGRSAGHSSTRSSAGARAHTGGASHSGHAGHAGPHRGFAHSPRIGFFVGAPLFAAPYYFYPPSYDDYPPMYYYPPPPPMYIQKPSQPFWYFCPDANGYYPHVQVCPGGWQEVLPEPAGPGPDYPG